MAPPRSRAATLPLRRLPILAAALVGAFSPAPAFVTLDTSEKSQGAAAAESTGVRADTLTKHPASSPSAPVSAVPEDSVPAQVGKRLSAKPHYPTALFLSADNMLVYSHIGVLKAFEEFGIGVDLVIVESRSVLVGAAWALGYSMLRTEETLLERPLSSLIRPHRQHGSLVSRFVPYGPDPLQVEIPLGLQSLQAAQLHWSDTPSRENDEYLHLAWMVAKLTHDAPMGPAEDLKETARPLAVQVADLKEERGKVLLEGSLQGMLKGGLMPKDVIHQRPRLWPYASGSLISGHTLMAEDLPMTFDRLLVVEAGRHLRPPSLEDAPDPWQDSLEQRLKTRRGTATTDHPGKVLRVELNPDPGFDKESRDPKAWVDLGYTSALRSMDVLLASLGREAPDSVRAAKRAAAARNRPLGLNQFTVNALASGGRQLLQDVVRKSVTDDEDSTGEGPITALIQSGYYSDLDVEWVRIPGQPNASLVFDARERSRLVFKAGANVANSGEDLADRGPEAFAGLAWNEPFYIPFRGEASGLLGGRRPGYAIAAMMAPLHPVRLELGVATRAWWIRYPPPHARALDLAPDSMRVDQERRDLFLNLYPATWLTLSTSIQLNKMMRVLNDFAPAPQMPTLLEMKSTDFQQTGRLALGGRDAAGNPLNWAWARYRNQNRVNLFGPVKYSASSFESRVRLRLGDFGVYSQYYWSNQDAGNPDLYDTLEAGEARLFSFQRDYFFADLRAAHFENLQAEYAPVWGRMGLRLMAGGYRLYGGPIGWQGHDVSNLYWEAQASLATAAGPLRAGLAGLQEHSPTYFIRFGADLDLDPDGSGP